MRVVLAHKVSLVVDTTSRCLMYLRWCGYGWVDEWITPSGQLFISVCVTKIGWVGGGVGGFSYFV